MLSIDDLEASQTYVEKPLKSVLNLGIVEFYENIRGQPTDNVITLTNIK